MALVMIPKIGIDAVRKTIVQCEPRRKLPGIVPVKREAIIWRVAAGRVERQDVVADSHRDIANRAVQKIGLCRIGDGVASRIDVEQTNARRLSEGELAVD